MERPNEQNNSEQSCERSAQHALRSYRERRRRRRSEDTFYGSPDVLLETVEENLGERERERRREEILEDAREDGMPMELAGMLYDIAREEGLDPALAYELVRTGMGVAPPQEGIANAPDQPVTDKYLPAWIFPAEPPDHLLRERMLRVSFRRLRSILLEEDDLDEAFRRFAAEPDVGLYGY